MKRIVILLIAATALCLCACSDSSKPVAEHIVLISFDGWAARGMDVAEMPNVKALMEEGSWTLRKRSVWPTSSDKNWPSMFDGTGPEINGFFNPEKEGNYGSEKNIKAFEPRIKDEAGIVPTIFQIYREKYPKAEIGYFYQWEAIHTFVEPKALSRESIFDEHDPAGDDLMCDEAVKYILDKKPNLLMLGWNPPDAAGHEWGWYSKEYFACLNEMDSHVGRIVAALKEAGIWDDTIILLSSDHGGTGRAHHGNTILEFETPFVICGKGIRKGHEIKSPMMQYDVAATMAAAARIGQPQVWEGKPVREAFLDKKISSPKPAPVSRKAGHVVVMAGRPKGWTGRKRPI